MNKRWLLSAMLVLGAVILVTLWLPFSTDIATKKPSIATEEDKSVPLNIHWRAGVAQQYRVLSESSMHMEAATSTSSSIGAQLRCMLDTLLLETDHDEVVVGMRLSSVELKINDVVDPEINRALSAPFRVRFALDGMPVAVDFPAEVSSQNRLMLENLVRMFQVSINNASDTWTTHESNGNGSYEAVYTRSGQLQIDKSKRKFSAPPASMLTGAEITSTEQLQIDPGYNWISTMSVDEKLKMTGTRGPKMTIKNHATLALQPDMQLTLSPDIWNFNAAAATDNSMARITHPIPDISVTEARKQIKSTIAELDAATQGRTTFIHRLSNLLRVDDSLPAILLDALQTQQLSDRTRADLYLVLQKAGTDSAQSALVSVFTDNSQWQLHDSVRAIVALGGVKAPNNNSIAALWDTTHNSASDDDSQRMASTAIFALGRLGNTMKDSSNPDYDSLRSSLLNNALSSSNAQQRSNFVLAVGNTQDSALAHEIVGLLNDATPEVRRATALSLGLLDVDQVADTLVTRYQQEDNSQVRSAITKSLESWSQPSASAMAMFRETVKTEIDENIRYNTAVLLGTNVVKFPENEAVLRELMRSEPSKRIRQRVANMLTGL